MFRKFCCEAIGILVLAILFGSAANVEAKPGNDGNSEKKLTLGDVDENPYLMAAGGWTGKIAVYDLNDKKQILQLEGAQRVRRGVGFFAGWQETRVLRNR